MSAGGWALAILALCAFAANGLLARAALAHTAIDAGSFTLHRLASGVGLRAGERPGLAATSGLTAALIGVLVLLLPGATAPPVLPALLMLGAGVAWGLYSLGGRGSTDPVADTAGQFLKAVPITAPRSCRESPRV
jgi:drug/metabolite transporter (DMT)-like permease